MLLHEPEVMLFHSLTLPEDCKVSLVRLTDQQLFYLLIYHLGATETVLGIGITNVQILHLWAAETA